MRITLTTGVILFLWLSLACIASAEEREPRWEYLRTAFGCENYLDVNHVIWVSDDRVLVWLRSKATPEEAGNAERFHLNNITPYLIGSRVFMQVSTSPVGTFEAYEEGCTIDFAWKYVRKHNL